MTTIRTSKSTAHTKYQSTHIRMLNAATLSMSQTVCLRELTRLASWSGDWNKQPISISKRSIPSPTTMKNSKPSTRRPRTHSKSWVRSISGSSCRQLSLWHQRSMKRSARVSMSWRQIARCTLANLVCLHLRSLIGKGGSYQEASLFFQCSVGLSLVLPTVRLKLGGTWSKNVMR